MTAFGLDIGNKSMKVVAGRQGNNGFVVTAINEMKLPQGVVSDGEVKNAKRLSSLIKELLENATPSAIRSREAIVSLPESRVFTRISQVPKADSAKLSEIVKWDLSANVTEDIEKMDWDWEVTKEGKGQYEILAAAVSHKVVQGYEDALGKIGVKIKAFDMEAKSLLRGLPEDMLSSHRTLLVDISGEHTTFSVYGNNKILYTSSIDINGDFCTKIIAKKLGVDTKLAEKNKQKFGIDESTPTGKKQKVALSSVLEELKFEIKRTLEYYAAEDVKIDQAVLLGGASQMPGLVQFLQAGLDVQVVRGDFSKNLSKKSLKILKGKQLIFGTAIGLAIRGASPDPVNEELNLIPQSVQEEESIKGSKRKVSTLFLLTVVVVSLILVGYIIVYIVLQADRSSLEKEIETFQMSRTKEQVELQDKVKRVNAYAQQAEVVQNRVFEHSSLIKKIEEAAQGVSLNKLILSSESQSVLQGTASSREDIVNLENSIKNLPEIERVENPLSNLSAGQGSEIPFEMNIYLK